MACLLFFFWFSADNAAKKNAETVVSALVWKWAINYLIIIIHAGLEEVDVKALIFLI
jgi:hypothetical protein